MKIAICDDSSRDSTLLKNYCEQYVTGDNIEYQLFSSGDELLTAVDNGTNFDILFLDVDMPGSDGIKTATKLRLKSSNVIIIFVTSYPEFAIDAFECEAFHYLLKPCDPVKLKGVLERADSRLGLLSRYHVVRTKERTVKLKCSEIFYVECLNRHLIYHMKNEDVVTREKISDVYERLSDFGFFQVHQGFIVNMGKIQSINKDTVTLEDGRNVMISVRRKTDVFLAYSKYVEKFTR